MKLLVAEYFKEVPESGSRALAKAADIDVLTSQCGKCAINNGCGMIELLREIPLAHRRRLFVPRSIAQGEYLFRSGDELDAVYVVQSGLFKHYFDSATGDRLVTGFTRPGQVLGIEALLHGTAGTAAVALEDTRVCGLPIAALEHVPDAVWSAWLMTRVYNERKRERMLRLISGTHSTAEARISYFLVEQAAAHSECGYPSGMFNLCIPLEDIASYLGLSIQAVSSVLSSLHDANIILFEWPCLTIIEPDTLVALAPAESTAQLR